MVRCENVLETHKYLQVRYEGGAFLELLTRKGKMGLWEKVVQQTNGLSRNLTFKENGHRIWLKARYI